MGDIYDGKTFFGTSANPNSSNVRVDDLLTIHRQLHDSFISNFKGIPVRVDPNLKGNSFYCAVSKEIFDELMAKHGVKIG